MQLSAAVLDAEAAKKNLNDLETRHSHDKDQGDKMKEDIMNLRKALAEER